MQVKEQVDSPHHPIAELAPVPGEVGQLPQDYQEGHAVHEPHHHRVRDEAHEATQFQETGDQHKDPGQDREHEEGTWVRACPVAAGTPATTSDMALVVCTLRKTELAKKAPIGVASITA